MEHTLQLNVPPISKPIGYTDNILLVGSCFTEHISDGLAHHKFNVLANPNGILFNPLSVADSLNSYLDNKQYTGDDFFLLNELWNSWQHHTRFSNIDKAAAVAHINGSQQAAAAFIQKADVVIITLGSAFQYYLKDGGTPVANNHRAPAQWFEKRLLTVTDIVASLGSTLEQLHTANPFARVIFTISPVRHIRDGVVDNNRSKGRLIDAVHTLCEQFDFTYYFPAYELIIDILRDYRFYDIDLVHPNYMATSFVWEQFVKACMTSETKDIMQQVQEIMTARNHRSRFPETAAHRKFLGSYADKVKHITEKYPFLNLADELEYFSNSNTY